MLFKLFEKTTSNINVKPCRDLDRRGQDRGEGLTARIYLTNLVKIFPSPDGNMDEKLIISMKKRKGKWQEGGKKFS